jgi:hypothetical protein
MRSLRNFQSQCCKIASEGLLYPDSQASRIAVCCCFCSAERYSHSRTEVRRIHDCIQSRARGDKSALVTKLAMQSAGVSAWSAETKRPTVVRRPGMHKEMCSLLAGMKRSQRNHAVPGNTELAGHGSGSGSRGRPARRHARKLKRGGRGHCAAVRVQCTDASGQAGVSGRIARMLKQQARRRAGLRGKLRRRAEHYKGFNQL